MNPDVLKKAGAALFFFFGIFLFVMLIFTLGKDKGITESKFVINVVFHNVGGLSQGAPVRLSGVTIGSVSSIDFLEEEIEGRRVKVQMKIFEKYRKQLVTNADIAIHTEGVLGEKLVEIEPLDYGAALNLRGVILGKDPLDMQSMAAVFSKAAESFTNTSNELGNINMAEMADVMTESSRALLITAEGINSIMKELEEITLKSKRLFDRLEQKVIDGDLFKVF